MDNLPIPPIKLNKMIVANNLATQGKGKKKSTCLSFQKETITVFPVIIHFLLAERNKGMVTASKDSS